MNNIKREDIKELYSIDIIDGTLTLIKRDINDWTCVRDKYDYSPDILINPTIKLLNSGVLKVSGTRLSYQKIRRVNGWDWFPTPLSDLSEGWEKLIFYSDNDILKKNVVKWKGFFRLNRVVEKDVEHLTAGLYLKTNGYVENQSTSNYRIVGFEDGKETKGIING